MYPLLVTTLILTEYEVVEEGGRGGEGNWRVKERMKEWVS